MNEAEAAVVRHIFQAFAAGRSPKAIALDLSATKDGRDLAMYFANGLAVQPVGSQTARFGTAFERPPGTL